jgi:ABC-type Zn2+ transport system substrate-binding protein/surface adhesin
MDDQLKQQLKEFGEALNNALFDSKQIARAVARIEEAGYEIFVDLESTVGVSKLGEGSCERSKFASELGVNPDLATIDDQLRPLMREFIEAIKSELDSEQLAHAAAPIKQKGYEVFLTLETTLKIGKSGKSSTAKEHIQL